MTKKNIFPVVATIAVVGVVLGVFSMTVMRDSNVSISTMTSERICQLEQQDEAHRRAGGQGQSSAAGCL